jgi:hypothetical protein
MTRRRAVVLASGAVLLLLGGAVALGVAMLTRTEYGREKIRAFAENSINRSIKGKFHVPVESCVSCTTGRVMWARMA